MWSRAVVVLVAGTLCACESSELVDWPEPERAVVCPSPPCTGNAWHAPEAAEAGMTSMRQPHRHIQQGAIVELFTGNQFAGAGGNPGNQLGDASKVIFRVAGGPWREQSMEFFAESGNNKFFRAAIDTSGIEPGSIVDYYFFLPYSDHLDTVVFGDEDVSRTSESTADAEAEPFSFVVRAAPTPSGAHRELVAQGFTTRVYDSGHVAIAGGDLESEIAIAPPLVKVGGHWREVGSVLASKVVSGALELTQAVGDASVSTRLEAPAAGIAHYEVTDWGALAPTAHEIQIAASSDEHFFGLGEKFNSLDQTGRRVEILSRDAPGDKGDRSYKAVPWFMSTRGYGFHLDSTSVATVDLRASRDDRVEVSQGRGRLAFNLVAGPELTTVLSRYTSVTGRSPLPPAWAFAPWMSSDIWRSGGEVRYVVEKYRELGIPGSVFVFDSPWETAYNDFNWNMAQFGRADSFEGRRYEGFETAAEMMAFLRDRGFVVVLWLTPFINVSSFDEGVVGQNLGAASTYDEAEARGYFVRSSPGGPPLVVDWWKGRGSPIDFTNPEATAWFRAQLAELVEASDGAIAGFKADDGESDFIPLAAAYHDGRSGLEMKNGYSIAYHDAVYSVLGDRGILFSRSGAAGSQAYPGHWAGDNEPNFGSENGLPSVIVAGQTAAMSGFSIWGHDIGGYQEMNPSTTPANLFMRWTQLGAFSPLMQMHRQVATGRYYPWSYGDAALENYRQYARLHTSLFPYIYSHAKLSAETGLPIITPLVLAHPDDPDTYDEDHAYLFGRDLLVAPMITNEATSRRVYLPAGRWYDWWTAEPLAGGRDVTFSSADQSRLPLYVRDGAIIPRLLAEADSLVESDYAGADIGVATADLQLLVYPLESGRSSVDVYDGTAASTERTERSVVIEIDASERVFELVVLTAEPPAVFRDGAEIERINESIYAGASEGWVYRDGFVRVKLAHDGGVSRIALGDANDSLPPEPRSGCGCRTGSGSGASLLWVVLLVGMLRRRSRQKK